MSQQENNNESGNGAPLPVKRRSPLVLMISLTLLALVSPFVIVSGHNSQNMSVKVIGIVGVTVVVLVTLLLSFLPKRVGFRRYDVLALLVVLIIAASIAPNFIQTAASDLGNAEEEAMALAQALHQYVMQHGADTLPAFFASQLGDAEMAVESVNDDERIYRVHTAAYDYTLAIRRSSDSGQAKFTFTALAAPQSPADSFVMDNKGKIVTFSTQFVP